MVFNFLHGLILFCKGLGANNHEYIYAGKNKLSLLFFGCNHPHYHYLILQKTRIEALMQQKLKSLKLSSLVLSRTQRIGHYQSGHVVIEELNEEAKRDLVGVPNETQLRRSFRNLDNTNKICASTFAHAEIKDPTSSNYETTRDIQKKVLKIRVFIHHSQYLENPMEPCIHTDITKSIKLPYDLVNFTKIAGEKGQNYIPKISKNETYNMNIIYSTEEEKIESEKIENLTFAEIREKIIEMIDGFPNKDLWQYIYKKEVAGKTKAIHIDFYNTLSEIVATTDKEDDDL